MFFCSRFSAAFRLFVILFHHSYFLTYEIQFVLFFSGAAKFCPTHRPRQLTRDTKSDLIYLQILLTPLNEDLQMTSGVDHHTALIVNVLFKTSIFQRKGKKNNHSSVSDADREIPTLRSTNNAGNSVNLVSVYRYLFTVGLGFLGLHRRTMTDSIYLFFHLSD